MATNEGTMEPSLKKQRISLDDSTEKKREDVIDWDELFIGVCLLNALRSKDPKTQVGACIVNQDKRMVGTGYNGFPNGCSDDELPWSKVSKSDSIMDTKHAFVCHAEMNAIMNTTQADLKNATIYVSLFPCNECAKLIIQSGIKKIIYLNDKFKDKYKASRKLLDMAGVKYHQYQPKRKEIVLKF